MYFKLFLFCGIFHWKFAEVRSQARVVGGKNASQPYAYQVSFDTPTVLFGDVVYGWHHLCGGSIISERHILTAAHCVVDRDNGKKRKVNEISILVGTHDLNNGGTRYSVCKTVYHRKYLSAPNNYDIAIVTVSKDIKMVPGKVESIAYSKEWTGGNVPCVLTGWGSTTHSGERGSYPTYLQAIHLSTISYEDCHKENGFITTNNLCTLADEGKGGCSGDSGGPLVDINRNVQVGVITSVNSKDCAVGEPDFYSRTSAFYSWIQHHTSNGECDSSANSVSASQSDYSSHSGNPTSSSGSINPNAPVNDWV